MYLSFIESGGIFNTYPDAKGRLIGIKISAKHAIREIGIDFLEKSSEIILNAGFDIHWIVKG
ncbi:MAG TPA: DUF6572 domain-containing protein [Patescibacteria group bacterium]|nr:DUF6572 domain-containing protein [Patescibacteria group bacterium]